MKTIIFAIFVLTTVGCATASDINSVSLGMTKAEVIEHMGEPVSVSAQADVEYLNYALYETNQARHFGYSTPYYVRIINGKVESYGRAGDFNSTRTPTQKIQIETTSKN